MLIHPPLVPSDPSMMNEWFVRRETLLVKGAWEESVRS